MLRWCVILVVLIVAALAPIPQESGSVKIASKKFTESVILGEMLAFLARDASETAIHLRELGGTRLVYDALAGGDIDAYVDYSGTILEEILANEKIAGESELRRRLRTDGVEVSHPLGFNNRYELAMKRERAEELEITRISDLARHPDLRLGFGHEFLDRKDGWQPLKQHYNLPQTNVRGLDHDIAYEQLAAGAIDVMDVYTTDAKILLYDMVILTDDRRFFPRYDAVILYRSDLPAQVAASLRRLEHAIGDARMREMNRRVTVEGESESHVAYNFLSTAFGLQSRIPPSTAWTRFKKHTLEHVDLVRRSLLPAILIGIPLGILSSKYHRIGQVLLSLVGIIQTIPALALLVFLIAPVHWLGLSSVGQGSFTAVLALFLYSLLPIVRNTYAGLREVAPSYHESAIALGLPPRARLQLIEMPLASRTILDGIKMAAVLNVGFATLGALIGAGGYGQPILTGIRLNDTSLILQGAIPAAVLALLIQWSFDVAERWLVPQGLRIASS